ncbi:MAG: DUF3263 domain-containing protein [Microbacteriaceae bacterium]
MTRLSERDEQLLNFESRFPTPGVAKNDAIRTQLGLSPVRYYQMVSRAVDSVEALQHDPVLVHRVRRLGVTYARQRQERTAP